MARVTPPPETSTVWHHDGETMEVWPGRHHPLGATWSRESTNFAVYAPEARAMWVCLFDEDGVETRHRLTELTLGVWHGALPGVARGARYGYRADGPWDPEAGLRFNPAKLLLDPYGRAVSGDLVVDDAIFGYVKGAPATRSDLDSAPYVPRSVVVHDDFQWGPDTSPHRRWRDTVIYEMHVKGMTALHDRVPERAPGDVRRTGRAGRDRLPQGPRRDGGRAAARAPVLLRAGPRRAGPGQLLGLQLAVLLRPAQRVLRRRRPRPAGHRVQADGKDFHLAGLEVILDVVYNHTAESGPRGPTLSFRGLDDRGYYQRVVPPPAKPGQDPEPVRYWDVTGCGNTVDATHTQSLRMILDSLRYWVTEMHVDGFRFDLMSALTRTDQVVDMGSTCSPRSGRTPCCAT